MKQETRTKQQRERQRQAKQEAKRERRLERRRTKSVIESKRFDLTQPEKP
jgi:hypothetical protein